MCASPNQLHEYIPAKVRHKIDALERPDCPLDVFEMAARLLQLAPDVYSGRPLSPTPSCIVPGTPKKIEMMSRRVTHGYAPTHPDDLQLRDVTDRRAMLPTDAGNGKPGHLEIVVEWSDVDWTCDEEEDLNAPLAERVRHYLREDQAIRERWRLERDAGNELHLEEQP